VSRSWRILGIAIRSAVTMGLNLRSESSIVDNLSKEIRYRVWWALFMLDTVLCVMTGRPPSTIETFYSTPHPLPYTEEEFGDKQIMRLITDHEARNTLMSSLLSAEPAIAARESLVNHTRSPHSWIAKESLVAISGRARVSRRIRRVPGRPHAFILTRYGDGKSRLKLGINCLEVCSCHWIISL
jgi:hypothetical protein